MSAIIIASVIDDFIKIGYALLIIYLFSFREVFNHGAG